MSAVEVKRPRPRAPDRPRPRRARRRGEPGLLCRSCHRSQPVTWPPGWEDAALRYATGMDVAAAVAARKEEEAEHVREAVRRVVAQAPPLTAVQKTRLRHLLSA